MPKPPEVGINKRAAKAALLLCVGGMRRFGSLGRNPGGIPIAWAGTRCSALQYFLDHGLFLGRQLTDRLDLQQQFFRRGALILLKN